MKKIENLYKAYLKTSGVSTDSRKVKKGSLFFALKGPNFDGSQFAQSALDNGAKYIVTDNHKNIEQNDNVFFVKEMFFFMEVRMFLDTMLPTIKQYHFILKIY